MTEFLTELAVTALYLILGFASIIIPTLWTMRKANRGR